MANPERLGDFSTRAAALMEKRIRTYRSQPQEHKSHNNQIEDIEDAIDYFRKCIEQIAHRRFSLLLRWLGLGYEIRAFG